MPRPRPTKKNRRNRFAVLFPARQRKSASEDLVGKFLFSVAVAVMTTLITLAFAGQVKWEIVVIAFLVCLLVMIVYQQSK